MLARLLVPAATFLGGLLVGASVSAYAAGQAPAEEGAGQEKPMVRGVGGVFLRAKDPEAMKAWYGRYLGMESGQYGVNFLWHPESDPEQVDRTVWGVFPPDTDYFGDPGQAVMINYVVSDLDAVLARLAEDGVEPVKETEEYSYGRFGWVEDADGNRIELWEPPEGDPFPEE